MTYPVFFTPIISHNERSTSLIDEMLITPEDILGMNNSLDDLYKKERVNINCFGSLTIKCSGFVYSASSYIGKITGSWMQPFTYWIYTQDNPWFITRNEKPGCEGCCFSLLYVRRYQSLCIRSYDPPVSSILHEKSPP